MSQKDFFIHRDISWVEFNQRVLSEAANKNIPLLERLKYIAIFSSNLDEFYMVRVAGLQRLIDGGYNKNDNFGYQPQEVLQIIKEKLKTLQAYQNKLFYELLDELKEENIFLKKYKDLSTEQLMYLQRYFDNNIYSVLTPMAIDLGRPLPSIASKTTCLAVSLKKDDQKNLAIIPFPKLMDRVIKLTSESNSQEFILLEELLAANIERFFKGYDVDSYSFFRITRDSELSINEDFAPDLLEAIQHELKNRPKANVVSMEVSSDSSLDILSQISSFFGFGIENIVKTFGVLDLTFLFSLTSMINRPDLLYRSFIPKSKKIDDIFDEIKKGDFYIHMPFESFDPTVDIINHAAIDDDVLAIKMTIYRTDDNSLIVNALKDAANNGKNVVVLMELKARFDEENNIRWSKQLEQAGCHVIYGFAEMKIHSKMLMIVRREQSGIKRYVHLSTGNYNAKTAKLYTDIGFFTCNDEMGKDISDIFNVITGYSIPSTSQKVVSAPENLRNHVFGLIDAEISYQKKSQNGFIFAKFNSLEDLEVIEQLYEASQAGVNINLIVRGICCLVPGKKGLSENITVKSVVGRFLEHTRIYMFNNNDDPRLFLSSADLMSRNLDRRIELLFEIYSQSIKQDLISVLNLYWAENEKSWFAQSDGSYIHASVSEDVINAQEELIKRMCV